MVKKIISVIFLFFLFIVPIYADELNIDSDKYILYNLNDNSVIIEHNSNEKTQIASLTKIMTTIVAIENIDDLNEKVTITSKMLEGIPYDASVAGLEVGDTLTYKDLLYGVILPSGADAVNALVLNISSSEKEFIQAFSLYT